MRSTSTAVKRTISRASRASAPRPAEARAYPPGQVEKGTFKSETVPPIDYLVDWGQQGSRAAFLQSCDLEDDFGDRVAREHPEAVQAAERGRWLLARKGLVTASAAGALLRCNGPADSVTTFHQLDTGEEPTFHAIVQEYMAHGREFEREACAVFEEVTGVVLSRHSDVGLLRFPGQRKAADGTLRPYLAATPDALVARGRYVVEVKCPAKAAITHACRPNYRVQILMQCICTGARGGFLAQYRPERKEMGPGQGRFLDVMYIPRLEPDVEARFIGVLGAVWDEAMNPPVPRPPAVLLGAKLSTAEGDRIKERLASIPGYLGMCVMLKGAYAPA